MMRKADLLQSRRQLTYAAAAIAIAAAVAEAGRDAVLAALGLSAG